MKKTVALIALLLTISGFAQNVSAYRYIVVPSKFSFQKEPNKYNLNSLTKMVFEKQGYEVYYDTDVLPMELAENRCKALYADMSEKSNMFMTKLKVELKDCKNQTVYISEEGSSNEKDYATAYIQAFREVGKSLSLLRSNASQKTGVESESITKESASPIANPLLFAQPTSNGFQLVDNTPKVVMRLFKSSATNFYIAQRDAVQGVVFNKNNQWLFEYYKEDKLVSEKIDIKF